MPKLLNYKIIGTDGQPLIILHGLFGLLDNWVSLAKRFGEHFQVILVDQRNHGKSFHANEFNCKVMSEDLEYLISTLNLAKPILLGHSMGGKTIMQYTAYHPDKADKLIVADIGPKQYPVHHNQIIKGLQNVPLNKINKRKEADIFLSQYISDSGIRSFLLKNLKRNSMDGFDWKMNLEIISKNIIEINKSLDYYLPIEVPVLFLRGSNSNYILEEDFDKIKEIFPNSEIKTINNAGHWLHAEQPNDFYQKVMVFLHKLK